MKNFDYEEYVSELNEKFWENKFFLHSRAPYQYITDGSNGVILFS